MSVLTLMVGLPGSGKSTYAREMADENTIVLSSDDFRKRLLGDERCQDDNELVFKTLYKEARELLESGKNVVIDATNINIKARRRALANFSNMDIDLSTHCVYCYEHACMRTENNALLEAAAYHDIGKLYTQTFGEDGQAHYYSHHNVGAYYYMCCYGVGDLNEIFYINFHMFPFFWNDDKTRNKYRKLFGNHLYENLMILHECDKNASGTQGVDNDVNV